MNAERREPLHELRGERRGEQPGERRGDPYEDAFKAKMRAQLHQWEARLEELKAKQEEAAADFRIKFGKELREAERQRASVSNQLRELEGCGLSCLASKGRARIQGLADRLGGLFRELSQRTRRGQEG